MRAEEPAVLLLGGDAEEHHDVEMQDERCQVPGKAKLPEVIAKIGI